MTARTCYTARGEVASTINPAGGVVGYGYYENKGLVSAVIDPTALMVDGSHPCGTTKTGVNANQSKTLYEYDSRGNRTHRKTYKADLSTQIDALCVRVS